MAKKKKKLHKKPTQEELEQNIEKVNEELEELETPEEPEVPEEPEIEDEEPEEEEPEEDEDELEEDEEPEEEEKPKKKPKKPKPVDYKKKFVESQREALILHSKNKRLNEAFTKASEMPDVTDEELQKEYPEWEEMSEFERKMARDSENSKRRMATISKVTEEFKSLDEWAEKVDAFISDPKTLNDNPGLEGREDEFRVFATKATRVGTDTDDLVAAFLYRVKTGKAKKKAKKKMFESGSGGPPGKPKPKKISIERARYLMEHDYPQYKKLLLAGKIEMDVS
jgi:hypothetical protein